MNPNKLTSFKYNNAKINEFKEEEIIDIIITSVEVFNTNKGLLKAKICSKDLDGNTMTPMEIFINEEWQQKDTFGAIGTQLALYGELEVLKDFDGKQIKVQMYKNVNVDAKTGKELIYTNYIFDVKKFRI